MNQQCPGDDGEGDENSQPHPTRVRLSLTEEMEREAESQLKRDLDWAGIRGIIQSHGDNEIVESSGSDDELEVEWEENENSKQGFNKSSLINYISHELRQFSHFVNKILLVVISKSR